MFARAEYIHTCMQAYVHAHIPAHSHKKRSLYECMHHFFIREGRKKGMLGGREGRGKGKKCMND